MPFARSEETVERERVLAHVGVDQQRDLFMQLTEAIERRERDVDQVAHAAYVHQYLVGPLVHQPAAKLRDHAQRLFAKVGEVSTRWGE